MKNSARFWLRHAPLLMALLTASLSTLPAPSQDNTGNKPEMASPNSAMAEHAPASHKEKARSTTLTIILKPAPPGTLPAAGGSLTLGDKTLTLTPADLGAMPHETVTVVDGHTSAAEMYSGVPVAALLARLGLPFNKENEHTLLKTYLVAEGTDGYRVLISVYETLATVRGPSAIVADALDGKPLASDGAFKLIIPGDKRPQRWVQNLKSITFKTVE